MKLTLDPVWPWWLIVTAVVAMTAALIAAYPRRVRHIGQPWRSVLITARVLVLLLILLCMLRPAVVREQEDSDDAVIYVLADASRTMQNTDETGGASRRQALLDLLSDSEASLTELGEKLEIRYRDFADEVTAPESLSPEAEGRTTAIGQALQRIVDDSTSERIAAILLLSDGRQAATGAADIDPVQAARLAGRRQIPVYATGFGTSDVSETSLDLSLEDFDVARDVFVRNVVPVRVRLKALGALGRTARVRILIEDRSLAGAAASGPLNPIPQSADNRTVSTFNISQNSEETTLSLQFVPQQVGEIKVAVEVEAPDDEIRRTNNRLETIIRVRQGGIRVAYFDRVRPEQRWLRQINRSSRIQLTYKRIFEGSFADRNSFEDELFIPGNYDAFIIGDVPAVVLGPQRLAQIKACCDAGAGLMMIGGTANFGAGGYGQTPLASLLPVDMPGSAGQFTDPVRLIPTEAGMAMSVMQIASPEANRRRWAELPPLDGGTILRPKQDSLAEILAVSENNSPLLIAQTVGQCRVLAFAGDTTWRWHLHADWSAEVHQRFWRQVIFWITKKETDSDAPIWLAAEPTTLNPGRPTLLTFGARDEDGKPIPDAQFTVTVRDPAGEAADLAARQNGLQSEAEFGRTDAPGDYWATVTATRDGQSLGPPAVARFIVNERDPELDNPAADPALLRELSLVSGGEYLAQDAFLRKLQTWCDEGLPGLSAVRTEKTTLWDNWPLLLLLTGLLSLEWFARKKRGLV